MGTKRGGDLLTSSVGIAKQRRKEMSDLRWSKYKESVLIAEFIEPEAREKIAAFDLVRVFCSLFGMRRTSTTE
jgi:hypothetical protein